MKTIPIHKPRLYQGCRPNHWCQHWLMKSTKHPSKVGNSLLCSTFISFQQFLVSILTCSFTGKHFDVPFSFHGECMCEKILNSRDLRNKTCLQWLRVQQIDRFDHKIFFGFENYQKKPRKFHLQKWESRTKGKKHNPSSLNEKNYFLITSLENN